MLPGFACSVSFPRAALALSARGYAANLDGSTAEVGNAEAARLYAEANAYVTNMAEGQYSYSYLQFYWKRAQANVDRILDGFILTRPRLRRLAAAS